MFKFTIILMLFLALYIFPFWIALLFLFAGLVMLPNFRFFLLFAGVFVLLYGYSLLTHSFTKSLLIVSLIVVSYVLGSLIAKRLHMSAISDIF